MSMTNRDSSNDILRAGAQSQRPRRGRRTAMDRSQTINTIAPLREHGISLEGDKGHDVASRIFTFYPLKTPILSSKSTATSSGADEDDNQDFEFRCEVPGQCLSQWQRSLQERRRAVSDMFGRNKNCTHGLPRLISICRMHYQANAYSKSWSRQRIAFAFDQLERNDEDFLHLQYTITVKDSEAKRLIAHMRREPEPGRSDAGRSRRRASKCDLRILQCIWNVWIGRNKSKNDCFHLLDWCYRLLDHGLSDGVPSIEMLPQLSDPKHAIKLGSSQKRLLQHIDWGEHGYNVLEDPMQVMRELQDAKLVDAEGQDSESESAGTKMHNENTDAADTSGTTDTSVAQQTVEDHSDVGTIEMPSSPPLPVEASYPAPSETQHSFVLPQPNASDLPVSHASLPTLQALGASIDSAITLSLALDSQDGLKYSILELMRQARIKITKAQRQSASKVIKSTKQRPFTRRR